MDILGIDLGTRYSCCSIWKNSKLELICDNSNNYLIPSIVSFYKSLRLVGNDALVLKETNPRNTIYDIKRIIGSEITDDFKNTVTFMIDDKIRTDHGDYMPEEISAFILSEIKKNAERQLQKECKKAVITVPAYFKDNQRQATLNAAKIAGLEVIKIINEPTAASIAYGILNKQTNKKIMVYDLGAGTLDVSLVHINNGMYEVLGVCGNTSLGGEDFDIVLMDYIIKDFCKKNKYNEIIISDLNKYKLKQIIENAKKSLSSVEKILICMNEFYDGISIIFNLTRKLLQQICHHLLILCLKPINDLLELTNIKTESIDEVVLIGGSTKIPKLRKNIAKLLKCKINTSLNPDISVSMGAAIYGYIMEHNDNPFSEDIALLDILPLSLGVEVLSKHMCIILKKGTIIPVTRNKLFTLDNQNETSALIKIYEGERKLSENNTLLGTLLLENLNKPKINIIFSINTNGMLDVSVTDKRSGNSNHILINRKTLSDNEITEIIKNGKENEDIDNIYVSKIKIIHEIKSMINNIKENLKDADLDANKILVDLLNYEEYINNITFDNLHGLEEKLEEIKKKYVFLIFEKDNCNFTCYEKSVGVLIHGEDDDIIHENLKDNIFDDIKEQLLSLCKNINEIINNPYNSFNEKDIENLNDYIETIYLWIYGTMSENKVEYENKIKELTSYSEKILLTCESNNFNSKNELQMTCLTLLNAIENEYITYESDKLKNKIEKIMLWFNENQECENEIYDKKINKINNLCNKLYDEHVLLKINLNRIN